MSAPAYALYGPFLAVKVRGLPIGQGNLRHLGAGRPAVHQNAKTLKPWRAQVQAAVEDALGTHGVTEGPIAADLTFTMRKPASAPKRRRTWPDKRPDIDHLLRACLDSIVAAGAVKDDAQVVQVTARKAFPGEHPQALPVPGLRLYLYEVGDPIGDERVEATP